MDENNGMLNSNNFAEFLILLLLVGRGGGLLGGQDAISNEFQMTQSKLDGLTASTNAGFGNTQMGFAALAQQLSKCCCDTQLLIEQRSNDTNRHIDQVLFETTTQATANAQRVVDRVDALQDDMKDQRIRDLETQLGQCNTRDVIGMMVAPINQALAGIVAQLNCGVKAIQYTPSFPVATPAAYASVVPIGGYCGGYPVPVGANCGPNAYPGYGWNN